MGQVRDCIQQGHFSQGKSLLRRDHHGPKSQPPWRLRNNARSSPFALGRIAAISQVALIFFGWCLAQDPNLVMSGFTVSHVHAPETTLRLLSLALGADAVVRLPSLTFPFDLSRGKQTR